MVLENLIVNLKTKCCSCFEFKLGAKIIGWMNIVLIVVWTAFQIGEKLYEASKITEEVDKEFLGECFLSAL